MSLNVAQRLLIIKVKNIGVAIEHARLRKRAKRILQGYVGTKLIAPNADINKFLDEMFPNPFARSRKG
jgi:hypothetical protein